MPDAEAEQMEISITPIPPMTNEEVTRNIMTEIRQALAAADRQEILDDGSLKVGVRQNLPVDPVTMAVVMMATDMARQAFKEVVLPALKKKYHLEERAVRTKAVRDKDPTGAPEKATRK